jgi:hypothetical protein
VNDPAAHDALARWLAYAHPAWMAASIALAAAALRSGIRLRRGRQRRARRGPDDLRRHLRLAKPAVMMIFVGFAGGPASMWWLRGREPFDTAHALAGCTALVLFAGAAAMGRRLERRRGRPLDAHAALALLAVLAAGVAAVTGFVLLP